MDDRDDGTQDTDKTKCRIRRLTLSKQDIIHLLKLAIAEQERIQPDCVSVSLHRESAEVSLLMSDWSKCYQMIGTAFCSESCFENKKNWYHKAVEEKM